MFALSRARTRPPLPPSPAPGKYTCLHAFELFIGVSPISLFLFLRNIYIYIYFIIHPENFSSGSAKIPPRKTVPCPAENLANLTLAAWPTRDKEANRRREKERIEMQMSRGRGPARRGTGLFKSLAPVYRLCPLVYFLIKVFRGHSFSWKRWRD